MLTETALGMEAASSDDSISDDGDIADSPLERPNKNHELSKALNLLEFRPTNYSIASQLCLLIFAKKKYGII